MMSAIQMRSGAITYIQSSVKSGSGIEKLTGV
jgi:hypothetical protein